MTWVKCTPFDYSRRHILGQGWSLKVGGKRTQVRQLECPDTDGSFWPFFTDSWEALVSLCEGRLGKLYHFLLHSVWPISLPQTAWENSANCRHFNLGYVLLHSEMFLEPVFQAHPLGVYHLLGSDRAANITQTLALLELAFPRMANSSHLLSAYNMPGAMWTDSFNSYNYRVGKHCYYHSHLQVRKLKSES